MLLKSRVSSLPGWEVILFPAPPYFPGNDAPSVPFPLEPAPTGLRCLRCAGRSRLHRNARGWHLPALRCVAAANCRLGVACKAEYAAGWEFCVVKIPRLDTDCSLFLPAFFVYSDEICFIHVGRFVQFLWAKQALLDCLFSWEGSGSSVHRCAKERRDPWVNGCFVPSQTGTPAAGRLVGRWNRFLSGTVKGRVNKASCLAVLAGTVPALSLLIRNLKRPCVLHKEFNISNLHALLLSAMCLSILITPSWRCGLPCKWRLSCFALWLGRWDAILEATSPLPAT